METNMRILKRVLRGRILKDLRESRQLKQSDLAEKLEITQQAYQRYEKGTSEPNGETLIFLADFYGVTTDYLLNREPKKEPLANIDFNVTINDDKFIELYSNLPDCAKKIFVETMAKLSGAIETNESQKKKSDDSEEKPPEYEEYTAGELHEIMKSSDEDNAV